jgi:hypothetical protein
MEIKFRSYLRGQDLKSCVCSEFDCSWQKFMRGNNGLLHQNEITAGSQGDHAAVDLGRVEENSNAESLGKCA